MPSRTIIISEELWIQTWLGLREHGRGKVESAAVWGGKRDALTESVEAVYFLDDLAGGLQCSAYHRVPTKALEQLFKQLQQDRRMIVGDIHTHPSRWVGLSGIDQDHPIEFRKGIHAIVLPSYALPMPSLSSAGVHEYVGEGNWRTLSQRAKTKLFVFS